MNFENFVNKVGGGPGVVTNGSTMQEEPAEMEIPLEEEEVGSKKKPRNNQKKLILL